MEQHKVLHHTEHTGTEFLCVLFFSYMQQWQVHSRENASLPNGKDCPTRMACYPCGYFLRQTYTFQLLGLLTLFRNIKGARPRPSLQ